MHKVFHNNLVSRLSGLLLLLTGASALAQAPIFRREEPVTPAPAPAGELAPIRPKIIGSPPATPTPVLPAPAVAPTPTPVPAPMPAVTPPPPAAPAAVPAAVPAPGSQPASIFRSPGEQMPASGTVPATIETPAAPTPEAAGTTPATIPADPAAPIMPGSVPAVTPESASPAPAAVPIASPAVNPLQPGIFLNPGSSPAMVPNPGTPPGQAAATGIPAAPGSVPAINPAAAPAPPAPPPEPEVIITEAPKPNAKKAGGPAFSVGLLTAKGARILTLSVPAPRGQIVDRHGVPFAQNVVVYFPCIAFPQMDRSPPAEKIQFARKRLDVINAALGKSYALEDAQILNHYENRRWLPLVLSRTPLSDLEKTKFQAIGLDGISLHPTYQRIYPQNETAGHIIGYVGKRGPWASGEIPDGEALWPTSEGMRGVEKEYEEYLKGSPGTIQIIFDEKGNRVEETTVANPVPGGNVVLAIDIEMQKLAERLLRERFKRGAFVIMDVPTGDVLAMASQPNYNPNEFVPIISSERFNELQSDPSLPMLGRAFQSAYPPASTFKTIASIGMLRSGAVNEYTIFPCPRSFNIGDRVAHNWAKEDEGELNIMGALTRSCNTWFYRAAMDTNSAYVSRAGEVFGYGRPTGIRMEEVSGIMPTNEWYRQQYGYTIGKGDLANIVIGQGTIQATPIQVARAMGAIGNRKSLMDARLALQVQDYANNIVTSFDVSPHPLNVTQHDLAVVHQGMYDVVHHDRGTGKAAAHPRMSVSGKTGTGQWIPSKKQNIAWFCGFAPSKFPIFSFAAVYEGDPGEDEVGGGKKAAPLVGAFFQEFLTEEKLAALERRSEEIAAVDGPMVDSVQLGTGSIIRGGGLDNSFDVQNPQQPPADRWGTRGRPLFERDGGGLFRNLFKRRY